MGAIIFYLGMALVAAAAFWLLVGTLVLGCIDDDAGRLGRAVDESPSPSLSMLLWPIVAHAWLNRDR